MRLVVVFFMGVAALLACGRQRQEAGGVPGRAVFDTLYLLPATDADTATMDYLQRHLADSFRVPVRLLPMQPLPAFAWYAPRRRYWADSLLKWMKPMAHMNACRWLLVTSSDISTTRKDHFNWGIMGLAYQPGRVAAISDYRLQEHRRPPDAVRAALLKIALHELGHTVGNAHCTQPHCLMQDADGRDKTGQLSGFCNTCRKRLFRP
ncbi:MAG: hypothetical protein MUF62_09965 [Chitinophagaceae bacterium]|nr:hypothetical protein [Chitinophagaceae bacterium]